MARGTRAGPAWPGVALVLVTAVASAAVASAVWAISDDGSRRAVSDPAEQVAVVQQACEQWTAASPPAGSDRRDESGRARLGDDEDRCAALAAWLADSIARTGRSTWMVWGSPERLLVTCQAWSAETTPPTPSAWCDDFVGWMSTHVPDWSGAVRDRRGGGAGWDGWLRSDPLIGP
ncbi:hypothetical protein [Jiangella alba]|uniref:Uncharacterized protein n=1 Tax=Jiangella alba TaxID=561176 RepID=A0A1H5PT66_9ACTN|nr:hypothetical protein [Jiangella alba]SEF16899.1 hypothetical protein SAMN04488561_5596 [Jiangella alba]